MNTMTMEPFGPSVQEVPLTRTSLVNVIAQVRFPAVMKIEADSGFVATFQELIRKDYPILRPERQLGVLIGPEGVRPQDAGTVWRFQAKDPDTWQVTLAPTFVSLSAKRYTRRSDLLTRFAVVLHALEGWLHPNICDRIGVRYVDRVTGDQLGRLHTLVRPEILGVGGDEAVLGNINVVHALSDTLFQLDDASQLRGRWGRLPAGATYDPGIEPAREPSWVLDLDHYTSQSEDFDLAAIGGKAADFCERIYTFFRWAVTDTFLDEFGAER
ncbi:MAG: TIGR04255 family protein [Actinobacteria bacterium]|nr:TIGR04255 family protein [Actinomycetota bacterium]